MKIVRQLRACRLRPSLRRARQLYAQEWTPAAMRRWQLERLNREWATIIRTVPYFAQLHHDGRVPPRFGTWQEFCDTVPCLDRSALQTEGDALTSRQWRRRVLRTTGGSTGEPLHIPIWPSEARRASHNLWYARSWFRLSPADKLFLIWGHSHQLGTGVRALCRRAQRRLQDALLGYQRYSAYQLSDASLRRAGDALLAWQPRYVLGYAVALDRFARVNRDRCAAFRRLGLKVTIATAESFPHPDSRALIADVLGCPVAMEYGTVESGPLAHQRADGRYEVFWRDYFLEGRPSAAVPGALELLVTSLYPRCHPLVRYRVGDLVSPSPDADVAQRFDAVIGRCNDYVVLDDETIVHSEAFAHAVKVVPAIRGYQVRQARTGDIELSYTASEALLPATITQIRGRLQQIDAHLAHVRIARVESLPATIAGKTRRVVRE